MAEACKTKAGRYYNGIAFCVIEMKLKQVIILLVMTGLTWMMTLLTELMQA